MELNFGKLLPGDIFKLPDGTWWVKLTPLSACPFKYDDVNTFPFYKKVEVVK